MRKSLVAVIVSVPLVLAGCVANGVSGPSLSTVCSNANLAYSAFTIAAAENTISRETYTRATDAYTVITEVCENPSDNNRDNLQTALDAYANIVMSRNEVE